MCNELASNVLFQLCEEIKPAVHGGRYVTSEEFAALVQRLNTAMALAEEIEEEKRILERQQRLAGGRKIGLALVGSNVVAFPNQGGPGGRQC
jgi:hypothetical protein